MELQIRLLGTVELSVDGRIVTPGSRNRRAVLAGLAFAANRSVSLGRLVEMVWAAAPPASAVANLRSHAAALRKVLGGRVIARLNAYELQLAPHELDVIEFQRLAEEGRQLVSESPRRAIPTLTAALAQWRGAAGDGLPRGTALDSRWVALDEQRLQVFEELAEARLAAGKHGDLLSELRVHLAAHPLRERAWGHLMLALYRCGDVPAALTAYQDARATLAEQLGVEPGEELSLLHRAILDRAPEVSYTPPPTVIAASVPPTPTAEARPTQAVGWTVPRELPADLGTFVGRSVEAADVIATITAATRAVMVINGPAGSGKSALAVRAAHAVAPNFPDGQVYVDLGYRTSVTQNEVLARVLRALGVASAEVPNDGDERAGWFRSLAAGRRLLLVVDGATRAAQVRPLLPAGPGPALIVVGQRHLGSLDGIRRVTLGPLDAIRARDLLATFAGQDQLTADPAATDELIRLCAGSVLALRIASSMLGRRPRTSAAALVGQLADGRSALDLLAYEDLSVRASLATSVAVVRSEDEVAGRLFELLGGCAEVPVAVDRAAGQLGVSSQRVRQALDELVDAHLLHMDGPDDYRLPALVREYAAELAAVPSMSAQRPVRGNPPLALVPGTA